MPVILGIVVLVVGLMLSFWVVGHAIGLVLMLFMAGLVGWLADAIVPGRLPYGWLGAIAAGLIGSWLGTLVLGHLGPNLFGVPVIPAFVGAVILAVVAELAGKALARPRTV